MIRRMCLNKKEKMEVHNVFKEKTGYSFKSSIILNQIFRRSSFAAETGQSSNEIFEFIGDQVLNYYVVKKVAEKCGSISLTDDYTFRIKENQFSQIKQALVNNDALAKIIDDWNIAKYLLLGKSDIKNNVADQPKIKADLLEALFGAIAIDSNWDTNVLETAVSNAMEIDKNIELIIKNDVSASSVDIDNAISTLKELAEKGQCTMPEYVFSGPKQLGYDNDGNPKWACRCRIINNKTGITRLVYASSKKDAKKAAAYLILCKHLNIQNKYGPNDWFTIWFYKERKLIPDRNSNGAEE